MTERTFILFKRQNVAKLFREILKHCFVYIMNQKGNITEVSMYLFCFCTVEWLNKSESENLLYNKHGAFKVSVFYILLNKLAPVFYQVSPI